MDRIDYVLLAGALAVSKSKNISRSDRLIAIGAFPCWPLRMCHARRRFMQLAHTLCRGQSREWCECR